MWTLRESSETAPLALYDASRSAPSRAGRGVAPLRLGPVRRELLPRLPVVPRSRGPRLRPIEADAACQLLEPCRDVYRVADHRELKPPLITDIAKHDGAVVQADAEAERVFATCGNRGTS